MRADTQLGRRAGGQTRSLASGYTLIEVLVAMMILAMALTVLMRMFSSGLQNMGTSADYAHAVLLAESQLAAVGSSETIRPGETSGSEQKFHWTRSVEDYHPGDEPHGQRNENRDAYTEGFRGRSIGTGTGGSLNELPVSAYQVTVVVEWPGRTRPRQVNLSTIKLNRSSTMRGRL